MKRFELPGVQEARLEKNGDIFIRSGSGNVFRYASKEEKENAINSLSDMVVDHWNNDIPTRLYNFEFDNFERELQPIAYDAVFEWTVNYLKDKDLVSNLVLTSPNAYGVGKTHLEVAALLKIQSETPEVYVPKRSGDLRFNKCPVNFITESGLLMKVRGTFVKESEITEESIITPLAEVDVLAIDDIGKTKPANKDFLQRVMFDLIDRRWSEGKHIIATTNLDLPGIKRHLGEAAADRLLSGLVVVMSGESYRKNFQKIIA